ncbi:MAG: FtsW/RodA/SpoVE family cell cycle protein [Kiritimatiellia bacterium]
MTKKKSKVSQKARKVSAETLSQHRYFPTGFLWFLLIGITFVAAIFPVAVTRMMNDEALTGAFFIPVILFFVTLVLGLGMSRPNRYQGDRAFVVTTLLLFGLGIAEQVRMGTWELSWTLRAYAPLLVGVAGFLFCLRWMTAETIAKGLPRLKWFLWFCALGTLAVLYVFGRSYRGGLFLPGQINPTELLKLFLIAFAAAWLPARKDGFSRTVFGLPFPPLKDLLALGVVWGIPVAGAVAVKDLGLVLILCLTLMLMLMVLTRKVGWLFLGLGATALAGWMVKGLSAHTRARFEMWLNPFVDPLGKGWQILQSLCAQYAGGLFGTGLGEGTPQATPIVSSDFIYAAIAEEWGWIGCALLLALYWLWILRASVAGAHAESETVQLFGAGAATVLGVQIILNVGGVTKALPMTGITLPFLSQGGFSLLTVLLLCGLLAAASHQKR